MTDPLRTPRSSLSLKLRLGIGAGLLGLGTLLTASMLYLGLNDVARRLDTALASETRMARYATLSQQTATFLVVATEAVQIGQPADVRADRVRPILTQIYRTFENLRKDVEEAVFQAQSLGLDEQSRYGTQSLGLARMEAMLVSTERGLTTNEDDPLVLRGYIDSFASSFDPLLSQAVTTEVLFRNTILNGIEVLRHRLTLTAIVIAGLTIVMVATFYFALVRPQFQRLDQLRTAAQKIGREDFDVALPATRLDEIGKLAEETNHMAAALAGRKAEVQAEWARLNDTIAQRTKELRAANATLEENDENRRRFFADVSHELRTPLTVILMEAQIGKQEAPEAEAVFQTIEKRAARLNRRIDDLLRIARSETGKLLMEPVDVPVQELLQDVKDEIQAELNNAGMKLRVQDGANSLLTCDPNWVRQVLASLIRNAIRHARQGGVVGLSTRTSGSDLILSVTDNGPGIPVDQQHQIFDRFVQDTTSVARDGFGIGLALAKWVIKAQNGKICLVSPVPGESALGRFPGTKISVRLPLKTN